MNSPHAKHSFSQYTSGDFIHSVTLRGGNEREGWIALSVQSSPTTYSLVDREGWSQNASHLVCQYLGFRGAYATVGDVVEDASVLETVSGAARTICSTTAANISECWLDGGETETSAETIKVLCCTGRMK